MYDPQYASRSGATSIMTSERLGQPISGTNLHGLNGVRAIEVDWESLANGSVYGASNDLLFSTKRKSLSSFG